MSFWSITVFAINKKWNLVHYRLGCIPIFAPKHSALKLYHSITKCLTDLGLDPNKVTSITTDEGGAAPLIASHFPGSIEVHCMAHLLNTTLSNAFKEIAQTIPGVMLVMDSCKRIASSINHSVLRSEQLAVNQIHANEPVLTLKQQVDTRWNSWLALFRSIKSSEMSLVALLHANRKEFKISDWVLSNSNYMFDVLDCLITVLDYFEIASKESCKEDCPTSFVVIAQTLLLQSQLTSFDFPDSHKNKNAISDVKLCLGILLKHLKNKIPFTKSDYICFALNPFYGRSSQESGLVTSWNDALDRGYQIIEDELKDDEMNAHITGPNIPLEPASLLRMALPEADAQIETHSLTKEISRFIKHKSKPDRPVLKWWKTNASLFPRLSALARRYLAIPATQAASERDFSRMRRVCTHLRNSLGPDKLWKISLVSPALSKEWNPKPEQDAVGASKSTRNTSLRSKNRILKLQKRFSSVEPNPDFYSLPTTSEIEDRFIDFEDGSCEQLSDEDYEPEELTEMESVQSELSDSDVDFELPPSKRRFMGVDDVRATRQTPCLCSVDDVITESFRFSVTFDGFPAPHQNPPPIQNLFPGVHNLITEWKQEGPMYYTFKLSEDDPDVLKGGRAFVRAHILNRTVVVESMYNGGSMDI